MGKPSGIIFEDDECAATTGIPSVCKLPATGSAAGSAAAHDGASPFVTRAVRADAIRTEFPGNSRIQLPFERKFQSRREADERVEPEGNQVVGTNDV